MRRTKATAWRIATASVILLGAACLGVGCPPPPVPPPPPTPSTPDAAPPPPAAGARPRPGPGLAGFFDLHTHPLSNLGFAGKLLYGGVDAAPDGGSLLPADPDCHKDVPAKSVDQALGHDNSTHGGWGFDADPLDLLDGKFGVTNPCGDTIRQLVVSAVQSVNEANDPAPDSSGYGTFPSWPEWNDITHQVMWIDWIRRAYVAGLSVMVTLAVNNQTLADAVAGPGDGPSDDMSSADLQIREMKALARRHSDWMEVAYSAADLKRIVETENKLALVLGVEIDNIGNFNKKPNLTEDDVRREIARLYDEGVRYVFPIHLLDNPFGTTAAYNDIFNLSNLREAGHFWNLQCAPPEEHIRYVYQLGNPLKQTFDLSPPSSLTVEMAGLMAAKLGMLSDKADDPVVPANCTSMWNVGDGQYPGLTPLGQTAILELMKRGMLIDVDHMSQASIKDALKLAVQEGYPVNSGHNQLRSASNPTERSLTADEYKTIGDLHGIAGVGGARTSDADWLALYQGVSNAMGGSGPGGGIGFGTDADGLSPLMPAPPPGAKRVTYTADFPMSALGSATWDYNTVGVAHYGMLADFLLAVRGLNGGADTVDGMMHGATYFYDTWRRAEEYSNRKSGDAAAMVAFASVAHPCPDGTFYAAACNACLPRRGACPGTMPPVCAPGRKADKWGVCSTPKAKPMNAAPGAKPTAKAAAAPGPRLRPGAYTLVIVGAADPETKTARKVGGFAVDVVPDGQRYTLRAHETPKAAGGDFAGFRGNRFLARIVSGAHVLVLTGAAASTSGPVTDVRGSYVAHTPGQSPVTGLFVLKLTSELTRSPTGLTKYADIGTAFLDPLRK